MNIMIEGIRNMILENIKVMNKMIKSIFKRIYSSLYEYDDGKYYVYEYDYCEYYEYEYFVYE